MRKLPLWLVALALCAGCSDRRLVANAAAAYQYAEAHYEWACVERVGPPECKADQGALAAAKKETVLCNQVQKVGKLPAAARKRLRQIVSELPK
jgi:hypothetical protein